MKYLFSEYNNSCSRIFAFFLCFVFTGLMYCSIKSTKWIPAESPLVTRWTKQVTPKKVLPEYPRPQMVRKEWRNLNGLWDLTVTNNTDTIPEIFDSTILVPFPIESALSGVGERVDENERIWYRRTFTLPSGWKDKRILLHFGAVDWETGVYINGIKIGSHRGGYDSFSFDITEYCLSSSEQEIIVSVWDPTTRGGQPRGKQTFRPGGIYYTPSSGIWQTVWIEPVPETYISEFKITPDADSECLYLTVETGGTSNDFSVQASALENGNKIAEADGSPGEQLTLTIPQAKLWSPESPYLYDLQVTLTDKRTDTEDRVTGYFALRKIEVRQDDAGITRLFLNNAPLFQLGPLDQGFWPDGLYTAPTDEALRYDIEIMKKIGFNMVRKHVKIEPDRWYYWCDKLGMLVWQDMPNGRNRTDEEKKQFEYELERMVAGLYNHPSIIMWVPFNEGWGQYDTERIAQRLKELDPARLVNNASGWTDRGAGDVMDVHNYPDPRSPQPEPQRAAVLGEFGGLGLNMPEHAWNPEGWGYDLLLEQAALTERYEDLFKQLLPLLTEPGLSAAVYTQITDIESENNGIMTYDREIIKIDPETALLAHEGYFPPETETKTAIFINETDVQLKCYKEGAEIRYTLDNSEPTRRSLHHTRPIHLTESATVRTRAFWENGKSSRINMITLSKVEPKQPVTITGEVSGLNVTYYEGSWDALPDFSELTPKTEKTAAQFNLDPAERDNNYALKFEGYIDIPETGVYTFYAASDDGSRLFIGSEMLIDNDGVHGIQEKHGAVALAAGMHPVTLFYFQGTSGKGLRVSYEGPGREKQEIPASILYRSQ